MSMNKLILATIVIFLALPGCSKQPMVEVGYCAKSAVVNELLRKEGYKFIPPIIQRADKILVETWGNGARLVTTEDNLVERRMEDTEEYKVCIVKIQDVK